MPVECGRVVFGKHSKFSTMRCRKRNFVLIDVEVGLLLTFLASMKAKVRLYQKYVSVFVCLLASSPAKFSAYVNVTDGKTVAENRAFVRPFVAYAKN